MTRGIHTRDSLLQLANSMAITSDLETWCAHMRDVLVELLPSVDRISININRGANLIQGELTKETVSYTHVVDRSAHSTTLVLTGGNIRNAAHFTERFRKAGHPVEDYRTPFCLSYSTDFGLYIGSIILWNRITSDPIDKSIVDTLESLRPFFTFVFVSAFARFASVNTLFHFAFSSIDQLTKSCGLTRRECEVLMCRFNGKSVAETAEMLHISEFTVRRHIRSLNARIGAQQGGRDRVIGVPYSSRDELED